MATLTKRCRHRGSERETCRCMLYLRTRQGGRDVFTPAGHDRTEAEQTLRRLEASVGETVAQAVDAWLALKAAGRANSVHTYRSRAAHVRSVLGAIPLARLRPEHVSAFVAGLLERGYAPATVRGVYALLTATLRHARRRGKVRSLPLPEDGPGIPAGEERLHDLTLREVEAILARMPGVWGRVAELVYVTGLRWGEIVAVGPDDVEGQVLWVRRTAHRYGGTNDPKTRAGKRPIPLSPRAAALFAKLDLPVGGDYRRAYEALVAAMGPLHKKGMGWHTIRAAHGTLLDEAGISLRESAARMGHGHRTAQTLGYHVRSETGDAKVIDLARRRAAAGPSRGRVPRAS
jgi:integrase